MHKILWRSGVFQIITLVVFILIVQLIQMIIKTEPAGGALIFWGIVFSIIPALMWLSFFYQRDRLEPEPKQYVFGVFLLGAFLAYSIGIPLVKQVFRTNDWLYSTPWGYILGSILIIGIIHEFLVYVAVRYTVFSTAEFDEWIDGIIYATAAGIGFATILNVYRVVELGGAKLVIAAIYCVVNTLAYASFACIVGYCLSKAKFQTGGQISIVLGLLIAALLNGLFFWIQRLVIVQGTKYNPWNGLIVGTVIVAVIYIIVELLLRRSMSLEKTATRQQPDRREES